VFSQHEEKRDTSAQSHQLPQIQLEDYTIIGLEKVALPRKERQSLKHPLTLLWEDNAWVEVKEYYNIQFKHVDLKPIISNTEGIHRICAEADYGSYNTFGLDVKSQFRSNKIIPFFGLNYHQSDGHVNKADYKKGQLEGGLEGSVWNNGTMDVELLFKNSDQGLWSTEFPPDSTFRVKTNQFHLLGNLEQKFNPDFSGFIYADISYIDHKNRFDYVQSFSSFHIGGNYERGRTSFFFEGQFDINSSERKRVSAEYTADPPFTKIDNSILGATLKVRQRINKVSIAAGITMQSIEQTNIEKKTESGFFPLAELAFNQGEHINVLLKYQPQYVFQSMQQLVAAFQIADFGGFYPTKIQNRIVAVLNLKPIEQLRLQIQSDFKKAESYPIVYSAFYESSSEEPLSTLNFPYPYWEYRYIEDAQIWKNTLQLYWILNEIMSLKGWITYYSSKINTVDSRGNAVSNRNIPYLPQLYSKLDYKWTFYKRHELRIIGEHIGERYDDVANSVKLKSYFLLNVSVKFKLMEYLALNIFGNNLFDETYQIYNTYSAPGITGGAALEFKF
jgi:hypothetical protein